jgi:endoglucanase
MIGDIKESPTKTILNHGELEFSWGSNSMIANYGMCLLVANKITRNQSFYSGALSCLDYLFGKNATGYCFITGLGEKNPMNPHHRISKGDGINQPVPGLLVGGPTKSKASVCDFPSDFPARRYVDEFRCYTANEVAINWNAPLVFLTIGVNVESEK